MSLTLLLSCFSHCHCHFIIIIIIFCIYKMINIIKQTYETNDIEVITDELGELWLNERHVQKQLRHKNLPALTHKYDTQ